MKTGFSRWGRGISIALIFIGRKKKEKHEKSAFEIFISVLMIASANPEGADATIKTQNAVAAFFF